MHRNHANSKGSLLREHRQKKAKDAKIKFPPRINSRDMKNQVDDTKLAKYVKANGNPDHSGP
jgi:hypothetical protein